MKRNMSLYSVAILFFTILQSCVPYRRSQRFQHHFISRMSMAVSSPSQQHPGLDALGFSDSIRNQRTYQLPTHVIFGSNALEHGINLLEEQSKRVLVVSGWNQAHLDPIMWELEPRGFQVHTICIPFEPSALEVLTVIKAAIDHTSDIVIGMGGGSVLDTVKMAVTLLNHVESDRLMTLSAAEVETLLLNSKASFNHSAKQIITSVTIPSLPSSGAELSHMAALRLLLTSSTGKKYIMVDAPKVCLIQPGLTRHASMEMMNDRIVVLIATAIDVILQDPGFLPEMLAWDALRQLMPLLDHALEGSKQRLESWARDPRAFEELTIHDDENDPMHRTQYFRRYGYDLSPASVADLCRIGAAISSARSTLTAVGGLQWLSDTLSILSGQGANVLCSGGNVRRIVKLFPRYLVAIQTWCNDENNVEQKTDPYKAFIRTKLDRISEILSTSSCFHIIDDTDDERISDHSAVDSVAATATATSTATTATATNTITGNKDAEPISHSTTSLLAQMRSLRSNLRLLAGPQAQEEVEETGEDMFPGGDSLSRLQATLHKQGYVWNTNDTTTHNSKRVESQLGNEDSNDNAIFDGYNLEDDEELSDLIGGISESDDDIATTVPQIHSRSLPPIAPLHEQDGYQLRMLAQEQCGTAPISLLDTSSLISLLSLGGEKSIEEVISPSSTSINNQNDYGYAVQANGGKLEAKDAGAEQRQRMKERLSAFASRKKINEGRFSTVEMTDVWDDPARIFS